MTNMVVNTDECPPSETLVDFYEGRLPEAALLLVSRHLEACSMCDSKLAKIHRCPPRSELNDFLRALLSPGVGYLGEVSALSGREIAARNIHLEESREGRRRRRFAGSLKSGCLFGRINLLRFHLTAGVDLKPSTGCNPLKDQ